MNSPTPVAIAEQKRPPGPSGIPILGNALQLGGNEMILRHEDLWRQYGDIVYLKLGPLDSFALYHPEFVDHVFVKNQKNYIKGVGYDTFRLLVGQGLVTSDGALWRQQRRLMAPPFTPKAITQFSDMMVEVTQEMLDRWQPFAGTGETLDMDFEMRRLTMSIIGRAMFSIDLGEELTEVGDALEEAFAFIPTRVNAPIPLSIPLPSHRRFHKDLDVINNFIAERIAEGRRNPDQENLLSILLNATDEETGVGMSEEQLRDEAVTLFFAGFETTARSLTWGWYLLSRAEEVTRQLETESDNVLGGRLPEVDDLFKLDYTRMVVDEVLRLYPPTAVVARQPIEDDEIGGYFIPAGSMITPVPYIVHRHPDFWPDPERFDPDRFLPEAVEARPKYAYVPFASGQRICLGNNFALMEMVYAFAMAADRFRMRPVDDDPIDFEFSGTMRPKRPLVVTLSNR